MTGNEFHKIVNKIEHVDDVSGLHLHILQMNESLGNLTFEALAEDEEGHLKDWLEEFHETVETVADEAGATSYNLTISGGPSPLSFSITFGSK